MGNRVLALCTGCVALDSGRTSALQARYSVSMPEGYILKSSPHIDIHSLANEPSPGSTANATIACVDVPVRTELPTHKNGGIGAQPSARTRAPGPEVVWVSVAVLVQVSAIAPGEPITVHSGNIPRTYRVGKPAERAPPVTAEEIEEFLSKCLGAERLTTNDNRTALLMYGAPLSSDAARECAAVRSRRSAPPGRALAQLVRATPRFKAWALPGADLARLENQVALLNVDAPDSTEFTHVVPLVGGRVYVLGTDLESGELSLPFLRTRGNAVRGRHSARQVMAQLMGPLSIAGVELAELTLLGVQAKAGKKPSRSAVYSVRSTVPSGRTCARTATTPLARGSSPSVSYSGGKMSINTGSASAAVSPPVKCGSGSLNHP